MKTLLLIIASFLSLLGYVPQPAVHNQEPIEQVGDGISSVTNPGFWKLISNVLQPLKTSWQVTFGSTTTTIPNLVVTNCVGCTNTSTSFTSITSTNAVLTNITFGTATGTSITSTNAYFSKLGWGNATGTNLALTNPLPNLYGGTGQDSSGWTGYPKVTAGVWSTTSINNTVGYLVGFTTNTYDGKPTLGASTGYTAANGICNANFAGSHVCTFTELQTSNSAGIAAMATNTTAWMANGPPGYLANSNDCQGWLNNDPTGTYAPFWNFSLTTGGVGSVVSCANTKTFSCCK
jgi:hypothetical protein